MLKDVDERLSALSKVASTLNAASDNFSHRLRAIEGRLNVLNLGVAVELSDPLDYGEQFAEFTTPGRPEQTTCSARVFFLGYQKVAGSWRITVRGCERWFWGDQDTVEGGLLAGHPPDACHDYDNEPEMADDGGETKPLLDCSRDIRLAAAKDIDALLTKIERGAQHRVEQLNGALGAGDTLPAERQKDASEVDPTASGRVGGLEGLRCAPKKGSTSTAAG